MRWYLFLFELIFIVSSPLSFKINGKSLSNSTNDTVLRERQINLSTPDYSKKSGINTAASQNEDSVRRNLSNGKTNEQMKINFEVEVDKNSKISVKKIKSGNSAGNVTKIVAISIKEKNDTVLENEDLTLLPQPYYYENNETTSETNSSYTEFNDTDSIRLKDFEKEIELSPEDLKIQEEWGGNCTVKHWDKCKVVESWFGDYKDDEGQWKYYNVNCAKEPVVCMRNGWTVNRCHLLCMGYCNKDMQAKYDKYVSHDGVCKANANG